MATRGSGEVFIDEGALPVMMTTAEGSFRTKASFLKLHV